MDEINAKIQSVSKLPNVVMAAAIKFINETQKTALMTIP